VGPTKSFDRSSTEVEPCTGTDVGVAVAVGFGGPVVDVEVEVEVEIEVDDEISGIGAAVVDGEVFSPPAIVVVEVATLESETNVVEGVEEEVGAAEVEGTCVEIEARVVAGKRLVVVLDVVISVEVVDEAVVDVVVVLDPKRPRGAVLQVCEVAPLMPVLPQLTMVQSPNSGLSPELSTSSSVGPTAQSPVEPPAATHST
jgi:hypothetical protein